MIAGGIEIKWLQFITASNINGDKCEYVAMMIKYGCGLIEKYQHENKRFLVMLETLKVFQLNK